MIYADNASTTKISDVAFEKMLPFLCEHYGNASSQYSFGVKAKRAVEQARNQVAKAINAKPSEITFTSGGSEGNSWVLQSVVALNRRQPIHIITSSIEHLSVLAACHALESCGVSVTYLPVDSNGYVSATDVETALRPDTKLVSIMQANNEIGIIQPISEIGKLLRKREILFHTDAVQTVGHIPVNVCDFQADFLTASAHKFNGAKGTGILYMRFGSSLSPLVFGGKQEHGLRAGTENVAGIVAAGYAVEESVSVMNDVIVKLNDMAGKTISGIRKRIPEVQINGNETNCLPGIINLCFEGISGESLIHLLDLKGICISTSSACNSGKDEPSHVLLALGLTKKQAKSSIRISYGRYNTMDDVSAIISAVYDAYTKIKENQ